MSTFEFNVAEKVTAQLSLVRGAEHRRVRNAPPGLNREFAGEPARSSTVSHAALGKRVLESHEPSRRGRRYGRTLHLAQHFCTGKRGVYQPDLRQRQRLVLRGDRYLFANVVGVGAQDCFPHKVDRGGSILKLDAELAAGETIGGAGRGRRCGDVFRIWAGQDLHISRANNRAFFRNQFEDASVQGQSPASEAVGERGPAQRAVPGGPGRRDGAATQHQTIPLAAGGDGVRGLRSGNGQKKKCGKNSGQGAELEYESIHEFSFRLQQSSSPQSTRRRRSKQR